MKRRSARPFVVEIKNQPRASRAPHPAVHGRDQTSDSLWRGLLGSANEAPEAKPTAAYASPPPDSQSGPTAPTPPRILPNLMSRPAPDAITEPAEPVGVPTVRRRGPNRSRSLAIASTETKEVALKPLPIVADDPAPIPNIDPYATEFGTQSDANLPLPAIQLRPARRRQENLPPGERWKRRLSRFAR